MLLYELLTGETPFDRKKLRSAALDEMLRMIREEEPSRPSIKLSTSESLPSIAANRHVEPKRLSLLVRGELDWIVMNAIEKDRTRRYETANAFADDIANYLRDEAVVACPPSAGYRFRKLVRRNRAAAITSAMIAASLLLGIVGTTWQAIAATKARNQALAAEELARQETKRANEEQQKAQTEAAIAQPSTTFFNLTCSTKPVPKKSPIAISSSVRLLTVLHKRSKADSPISRSWKLKSGVRLG